MMYAVYLAGTTTDLESNGFSIMVVIGSFLHPMLCHLNAALMLTLVERREIVLQQPVDEDVSPADFAEEDALGGVVEEAGEVPGQAIIGMEDQA